MDKKTLLLIVIISLLVFGLYQLFFNRPKNALTSAGNAQLNYQREVASSKTLKAYSDPTGFSFNYPDNLSIFPNELKDSSSYADLQLTAKGVDGSLHLKISDSNFKFLDEWVKSIDSKNPPNPKESKLGTLKAQELTTNDKLLLGALDSGILFNIEIPTDKNKDFWMSVYNSVLNDFTFSSPSDLGAASQGGSLDEISFEGEEVVN